MHPLPRLVEDAPQTEAGQHGVVEADRPTEIVGADRNVMDHANLPCQGTNAHDRDIASRLSGAA